MGERCFKFVSALVSYSGVAGYELYPETYYTGSSVRPGTFRYTSFPPHCSITILSFDQVIETPFNKTRIIKTERRAEEGNIVDCFYL